MDKISWGITLPFSCLSLISGGHLSRKGICSPWSKIWTTCGSKWKAWLEHYQRLLNAEFDWDPNHLSDESPMEGPPIPITIDMVKKAISQMKAGKALCPSGIVVEMIRAAGTWAPQ